MQAIKTSLVSASLLAASIHAQTLDLDTIYVTGATKSEHALQDITANVDVITAAELQERQFTTVAEALNTIAGVNFASTGGIGQTTDLYVRGFASKRVLVMIDGIRFNDPTSLSGAPLEHLMISDIERIEVIKGPQSGIWGADASAGVINIITKSAKEGLHAALKSEFGSYSTAKYGAALSYKNRKFDIKLNFDSVESDGFSAMVPEGENVNDYENDGYDNKTANIKTGFNFTEKDRIEAFYQMIDSATAYDGGDFGASIAEQADSDAYSVDAKQQFYALSYLHDDAQYKVKLFANKTVFERDYAQGYTTEFDGENSEFGLQTEIAYMKNGDLVVGADHKKFTYENEIDNAYKGTGYYITNSNLLPAMLGGETLLTESVRFDNYDAFKDKITYKAGIKHFHHYIKEFTTSFNYATAYHVPSLYQLYSPFGNRDLEPENIKGYDVTLEYKKFSVTYFNQTLEDIIDYDYAINKYNNIEGKSTFKGVEAKLTQAFEAIDTVVSLNYTHVLAEDSEGYQLAKRPKESANIAIDYYGIEDFHFGVLGQYVGERVEYHYGTHEISAETGNYMVWDLAADVNVNQNMDLYVKAKNIFDKQYQVVDHYATEQRSVYLGVKFNY